MAVYLMSRVRGSDHIYIHPEGFSASDGRRVHPYTRNDLALFVDFQEYIRHTGLQKAFSALLPLVNCLLPSAENIPFDSLNADSEFKKETAGELF